MSSIRRNCTTISRKTQAMYHRENRKQRVIAKAFGVSDEVFNSGGGWGNNGKSFCNYLTAQDKKARNARNSLSAHKTYRLTKQRKRGSTRYRTLQFPQQ